MKSILMFFVLVILSGCASRDYIAPAQGPLSTIDFYFPGADWSNVVGVFEDGENCKGLNYAAYLEKTEKVRLSVRRGQETNFFVATNSPRDGLIYQNWLHCGTSISFEVSEESYSLYSGIQNGKCVYSVSGINTDGDRIYPEFELREYVQDSLAGLDSLSYCKDEVSE